MRSDLRRIETVNRLISSGIVAVIRADCPELAARTAEACLAGGITAIEIAYTTPGASEVIRHLREKHSADILAGAGTVIDPETARAAILAGAQYIVAPSVDENSARLCNRYQIPYLPGASTVSEVISAMEVGASIVKIFPGETLGPAFIRAVHGPLPQAPLMPTGGVTVENAREWLEAGSVALGIGSNLTRDAKSGDFASVTALARKFVQIIHSARNQDAQHA
jgi:2-dehydro-3-deoxyphosphogluconate aldolase/(4S)-4-hydroxy-2-oxoglutarate aldolase